MQERFVLETTGHIFGRVVRDEKLVRVREPGQSYRTPKPGATLSVARAYLQAQGYELVKAARPKQMSER